MASRPLKMGLYLNAQQADSADPTQMVADLVQQTELARDLGFDSIWGGEHHVTQGAHYLPLLPLLFRLSAHSGDMELGTNLVLLPLHNPVGIAEQAALLDIMCGGRFTLGVGLGYRPEEFAAFGVPMKERVGRMVEGIELIRRLWTEDEVTHHGRYLSFDNLTISPKPAQRPRPLIMVGAQVDKSVARAAKVADGWLAVPLPTMDELRAHVALVRSVNMEAPCFRLLEVSCGATNAAAVTRAAPYLLEKYAAYASWGLEGLTLDPAAQPEDQFRALAANRFVVGDPAEVVDGLVSQWEAGISHVTMRISWPGMPQKEILAGIELLGTDVLAEVRRRTN